MVESLSELTRILLLAATGVIVLAGTTADLYLIFLFQRRTAPVRLPAQAELRQRPFTSFHALQVLFITLVFAAPTIFQKTNQPTPSEATLICGPLLYALMGLLVVAFCLVMTKTTFRDAFTSKSCTARQALVKGVLYGLAVIPPVILVSQVTAACTEALGYESRLQEVFDWFNDGTLSLSARVFMMAAAVFIAPVTEETLFRGILFPVLLKGRAFASAALLSGLFFALIHFHAPSLLPLLALSIAFSAAYATTGSLLTPIVMHALFNTTSLLLYLADKG